MPIVMRRMALVGLVQGLVLWFLAWLVEGNRWPSGNGPVMVGLVYAALAAPAAWYLSEDIDGLTPARRRGIVIGLTVLMGLLGACEGWVSVAEDRFRPGAAVPASAALAFIAMPLLLHARAGAPGRKTWAIWQWNYAALFQTTWRNAMMLAVAGLLTGIFWGVLFAGAHLMKSIGITLVLDLITLPIFISVASAVVFACAMALTLARADTIVVLRRFWLSLNQAFLPLVLLFSTMWAIALPFTGVAPLFETGRAGLVLLWFAALAVNFVNAARQDGLAPAPFVPWLRRALAYAWLSMLVVVGVAAFAIYQRVAQYGWTAERVWSVFVLMMAAGYALGYSLSVFKTERGWMWSIDQTNVAMAIVLCAGLIALSSPLADARRISVASQVDRLLAGKTKIEEFDFYYLKSKSGLYGTRALQALANGVPDNPQAKPIAEAARTTLDGSRRDADALLPPGPTDEELRARLRLLDGQVAVPPEAVDALIAYLRADSPSGPEDTCMFKEINCLLWMGDLDEDGKPELLMVIDENWQRMAIVFRWHADPATLTRVGKIDGVTPEWITGLSLGAVKLQPSPWRDVEAGGVQLRVVPLTSDR